MASLQETIDAMLEDLPVQLLSKELDEKLRLQGIRLSKRKLEALTRRVLHTEEDNITVGRGDRVIEFTEADAENLSKEAEAFLAQFPTLVQEFSNQAAIDVLATLKKGWRREWSGQRREMDGFRKRLELRWRKGLEPLRILTTVARELGSTIHNAMVAAGGGDKPKTFDVLVKLHARACQVADEVICLLSNGFADGAMARWRTMQEIASVAYLIHRDGDELAERYLAHEVVEARKAALQYQKHCARLGQTPFDDAQLVAIENEYQAALAKYDEDFRNAQGWAAKALKKRDPSIADIQQAAELDHLGPYYRMASHNVHANPKGVLFKLGLIGDRLVMLAGASNAGLADPGHATALSLVQVSSLLLLLQPTLDNNLAVKVMVMLSDEVGDKLVAVHEQLLKDEADVHAR